MVTTAATAAANGEQRPREAARTQQHPSRPLSEQYPVNTLWEMTLENGETVSGRIYCTDDFSGSVVLQRALVHTTLASEVRIVHASAVVAGRRLPEPEGDGAAADAPPIPLSRPLPKIHKKALEERERKALKQAEESFKHINQKVRYEYRYRMVCCCVRAL